MYSEYFNLAGLSPQFTFGFLVLMAWTLVWKGIALWKSARNGDKYWYIALLIVNTAGILEILYIYVFSKKNWPAKITQPPQQ